MANRRGSPLLAWAVLVLACGPGSSALAEEMLRIAVDRAESDIAISGPELVVSDPASGEMIAQGSPVRVGPADAGIRVNGKVVASDHLRVLSRGVLVLRNHSLERQVELHLERRGGRPRLLVVHEVPIEAYVAATVSSEMPPSWPAEALKAQAVATRTFAVHRKFNAPDRPYHMEAGVIDQVYGGAGRMAPTAVEAARATYGEVLTYHRRPARTYFHSCCAGHTESSREGWGNALPYLPGVACGFDSDCPAAKYRARIPLSQVAAALRGARIKVQRIDALRITKRTSTRRVDQLVLDTDRGEVRLSGEDLRRLVGYTVIKSRMFEARIDGKDLVVEGQGSGHGVGLCQWGARGMAVKGRSYDKILLHYYPRTKILRMY
ncbi:MAG: SpoIID/LytB domain-containing protein [Pseudomonadota bacterium]